MKCTDKSGAPVHYDYGEKIDLAVFPGLQGGPHNHAIAGVAVAMGLAATDEFRDVTGSMLIEKGPFTFLFEPVIRYSVDKLLHLFNADRIPSCVFLIF